MEKPFDDLTRKDFEVLSVLWDSKEALSYGMMVERYPKMNANTVQAELRKLLNKKLVEIDHVGYSGRVLCRYYRPTMTPDAFAAKGFAQEYEKCAIHASGADFMRAFLDGKKSKKAKKTEIEELEKLIEEYKKEM